MFGEDSSEMSERVDGVTYRDIGQPRKFFTGAVTDFYEKMGRKDFWTGSVETRDVAVESFMQDYIRTDHGNDAYNDAITFEAAMREFGMRELYMAPFLGGLRHSVKEAR